MRWPILYLHERHSPFSAGKIVRLVKRKTCSTSSPRRTRSIPRSSSFQRPLYPAWVPRSSADPLPTVSTILQLSLVLSVYPEHGTLLMLRMTSVSDRSQVRFVCLVQRSLSLSTPPYVVIGTESFTAREAAHRASAKT
jgi:hypothetical protein